jgi:hypothetical protein
MLKNSDNQTMFDVLTEQKYIKEALGIYEGGACNPIALVNFLHRFVDIHKDYFDSQQLSEHVVMRLVLAQLSSLAGIGIGKCADADKHAHMLLGE